MAFSDLQVGSFAYLVVGEGDFFVKRLEVAPFVSNTADASVHFVVSERYARRVISEFNFPVGIEIIILAVKILLPFVL